MVDEAQLREIVLGKPELILDDRDMMQALLSADNRRADGKVIDLREVLMGRLEERLGALEDTHRTVIAAAYENIAGTRQVHRAVLSLLEPLDFGDFLDRIDGEVAEILGVDRARLVMEIDTPDSALGRFPALVAAPPGTIGDYLGHHSDREVPKITLRRVTPGLSSQVYGTAAPGLKSEAVLRLFLGPKGQQAILAFGAIEADRFGPDQATDLLEFFTGVFERALRRFIE